MKLALLGNKLSHSKSPLIHQIILKHSGIHGTYDLLPLDERQAESFFTSGEYKKYDGFNITIPYKGLPLKYLNVSNTVLEIGAANTVCANSGMAYNTDYLGFLKTFYELGVNIQGKKAYIIGTGGAAKACAYAFLQKETEVSYISRSLPFDEEMTGDILVNATPVGMYPNEEACPISDTYIKRFDVCLDLIYNPYETIFLKKAKELGKTVDNGLTMLIYQAIYAHELWQGQSLDHIAKTIADEVRKEIYA